MILSLSHIIPSTRTMRPIKNDLAKWLLIYAVFGFLHELVHILIASCLNLIQITNDGYLHHLHNAIHRRFVLRTNEDFNIDFWEEFAIRHSGWLFSVGVAAICRIKFTSFLSKPFLSAVYAVAFDSLVTDLLCFKPIFHSISDANTNIENTLVFYCGNFGMIILNPIWFQDSGKFILDVIEKMVEITMIRGAQSGGVVTFDEKNSGNSIKDMVGSRTRVVKSKRGDLSVLLRKNLSSGIANTARNIHSIEKSAGTSQYIPKFYAGHTRFATSSVADFSGTHPHQWSEPSCLRVYDFSETVTSASPMSNDSISEDLSGRRLRNKTSRQLSKPHNIRVENFISHNGDFEFYELNDVSYDTDAVMKWLEIALESKQPAYVDSAGIAGMIDLIRCQACFPLSIRFAVCLGLPTSKISNANSASLPKMSDYKYLGECVVLSNS